MSPSRSPTYQVFKQFRSIFLGFGNKLESYLDYLVNFATFKESNLKTNSEVTLSRVP